MDWNGDIPAYSDMQEVWVKIEGIPPKYLSWKVMIESLLCGYPLMWIDMRYLEVSIGCSESKLLLET
jgi:hypothetical protein